MHYIVEPIGHIESKLQQTQDAPRQGYEGAPDAWLEIRAEYKDALDGIEPDDTIVLLTWLHLADRRTLKVHPRSDPRNPLTGVFATRSPDRPNPIGLHEVTVKRVDGPRLLVGPLEAIDGTPVIDIKPVI